MCITFHSGIIQKCFREGHLMMQMMSNAVLQIFKTAPEFADVANSRVLNSKPPVMLSSSQVRPPRSSAPPPPGSQMNSSGAMSVSGSTVVDSSSSQDSTSPYPNNSMALSALVNSNNSSSIYQSPMPDAGGATYSQTRAKLRPTTTVGMTGQFFPGWNKTWFVFLRYTLLSFTIVERAVTVQIT